MFDRQSAGASCSLARWGLGWRLLALLVALSILQATANACSIDSPSAEPNQDSAGIAARGAFVVWATGRGIGYRELTSSMREQLEDGATVRLDVTVRTDVSQIWRRVTIDVPVQRNEDGAWIYPETALIDRLVLSAISATAVAGEPGSATRAPATATPRPTPSATTVPTVVRATLPPPTGEIVYTSDWSQGSDGWIGTLDWNAIDARLVNDGSRGSRDPWIEAPIHVDPSMAMTIEFQAEILATEFGSFGLVARAGGFGWFEFGVRSDPEDEGGVVAMMAVAERQNARFVEKELLAVPRSLSPGPHLYRAEFGNGVARFFIDGEKVGEFPERQFVLGEFMGLWAELTHVEVHTFRVTIP